MQNPSDEENLETISAIMAELRADAKPLARDLVKGVKAFAALAITAALLTGITLMLAIVFLFPQYYGYLLESGNLRFVVLPYPIFGLWVTITAFRRYRTLIGKYSRLIEVSEKLGD